MTLEGELWIDYTNHRGERKWRHILPSYTWFEISKYHEGRQWFLMAMDLDKGDVRAFAMLDIHGFSKTDQTNMQQISLSDADLKPGDEQCEKVNRST